MALMYGGVSLTVVPDEASGELEAFLSSRFSLTDLIPFDFKIPPSLNTINWPKLPQRHRPIKLNSLYWPTGAARWAYGFFLAGEQDLASIRELAYADDTYTALTLSMDDESEGYDPVETDLWMLPPVPLLPQKVTYQDDGTALLASSGLKKWLLPRDAWADGTEPLYLLPLVDDRYFWWHKAASITVTENTTTWANLFSSIASALGITLTTDTIASAYLKPAAEMASRYEYLPLLLDAVASSVGHRVVRQLDGTVSTQGPATALTSLETQLALDYPRIAGGLLATDVA